MLPVKGGLLGVEHRSTVLKRTIWWYLLGGYLALMGLLFMFESPDPLESTFALFLLLLGIALVFSGWRMGPTRVYENGMLCSVYGRRRFVYWDNIDKIVDHDEKGLWIHFFHHASRRMIRNTRYSLAIQPTFGNYRAVRRHILSKVPGERGGQREKHQKGIEIEFVDVNEP